MDLTRSVGLQPVQYVTYHGTRTGFLEILCWLMMGKSRDEAEIRKLRG